MFVNASITGSEKDATLNVIDTQVVFINYSGKILPAMSTR